MESNNVGNAADSHTGLDNFHFGHVDKIYFRIGTAGARPFDGAEIAICRKKFAKRKICLGNTRRNFFEISRNVVGNVSGNGLQMLHRRILNDKFGKILRGRFNFGIYRRNFHGIVYNNRRCFKLIEFKNIFYAYDGANFILNDVNFQIAKGETVFVGGSNGAGKSTLLKIINGIIFPTKGKFIFEGVEITEKILKDNVFSKKFHQKIGYIWQNSDAQLFCGSVEEEISFGPLQMGLTSTEIKRRVDDAISLFKLEHLRKRAPYYLSGGEKKKTAIASIFVMNPAVWTLDEPLNELDDESQNFMTDFLIELKNSGKTIIFSSHDKFLADKIADRKIILGGVKA